MMLTSDELAAMRTTVEIAYPDTCVIYAPTYTSDGAGGQTLSYAIVTGGTVSCRVRPFKAAGLENMVRAGGEGAIYSYVLSVPHDAPIALDRRVRFQSVDYEIAWLSEDMSWNLQRQAYLRRIE